MSKPAKDDEDTLTVDTMPIGELRSRVTQIGGYLAKTRALLPGLVQLDDVDRLHTEGRLRAEEPEALGCVLDVVEAHPHYFVALADKDFGKDPKRFEVEVLRERLERRALIADVAKQIAELAEETTDHVLHLGELTKPPVLAAYHIAKPLSEHDVQMGSKLAAAKNFYGRSARRAAETRKKNAGKTPKA